MRPATLDKKFLQNPEKFWALLSETYGDASARIKFQDITRLIAIAEAKKEGAKTSTPGNPDGGVDCLVHSLNGSHVAWQAKFIFDPSSLVTKSKDSIESLAGSPFKPISEWVITAPIDVSAPTQAKIIKAVHSSFDSSVKVRILGATDLIPLFLELGEDVARSYFGRVIFPRLGGWFWPILVVVCSIALIFAIGIRAAEKTVDSIRAVGMSDFEPPQVRALMATPLGVDLGAGLVARVQEINDVGFVGFDGQGKVRLDSIMGSQWSSLVSSLMPSLRQYLISPSGQRCVEFIGALGDIQSQSKPRRSLLLLFLSKDEFRQSIDKAGLICQLVGAGDLRMLAIAAVIAEYDRQRCSLHLVDGLVCSGQSSSALLGARDWESLLIWIDSLAEGAVTPVSGYMRFGACDDIITHVKLGDEGDDLVLRVSLILSGNMPVHFLCDLVSWSDISFEPERVTPSKVISRKLGLALNQKGELIAYRVDDGSVAAITIDAVAGAGEDIDVAFSHSSRALWSHSHSWHEAPDPFKGGLSLANGQKMILASQLFDDSYGYDDEPERYALSACTSRATQWNTELAELEICQANALLSAQSGLELWDGSETLLGHAALDSSRAELVDELLPVYSIQSGESLTLTSRTVRHGVPSVLSFVPSLPVGCELSVRSREGGEASATTIFRPQDSLRRVSVVLPVDAEVRLSASCASSTGVTVRYIQWEGNRTTPTPIIELSPIRSCRKRQIGTFALRDPIQNWPILLPRMNARYR